MEKYKTLSNFGKKFYIPSYVLTPEAEAVVEVSDPPESPILVFINSKSGGQLGSQLILTYRTLLSQNQRIYINLGKLKDDSFACKIRDKLKIIVAGGDGTAGWILRVVSDLKLPNPPPITTVPLGTGNNLPFAFGWSLLEQVINAKEMKIDNWHLLMRMKSPKTGSCNHIASLELPHSFHRVFPSVQASTESYQTFRGGFWNYFSLGIDAQVSYAFHKQRKLHPEKYKNQLVNQSTYLKLGFTQGWFCAPLYHPSSQNIAQLVKVKICNKSGQWSDLHIPQRSIVCLNLPSFSGGLNPWGTPNPKKQSAKSLTPSYVDDGMIEIVGFRDAWHGLVLLAPKGHGIRLAQARQIQFEFKKGAAKLVYMRMDGEPWKQPMPLDDETVVIEISHHGQVKMLATNNCRSQSMYKFTYDEYQDQR